MAKLLLISPRSPLTAETPLETERLDDGNSPFARGYREGVDARRDVIWRLINSLECTTHWLENGRNPIEAAEELRVNLKMLRALR